MRETRERDKAEREREIDRERERVFVCVYVRFLDRRVIERQRNKRPQKRKSERHEK